MLTRSCLLYFLLLQILWYYGGMVILASVIEGAVLFPITQDDPSTIVKFQVDGAARKDTFLRYRENLPEMKQITICFRVYFLQFRDYSSIFSYATPDFGNELYLTWHNSKNEYIVECCNASVRIRITTDMDTPSMLRQWLAVCFTLDLIRLQWQFFVNDYGISGSISLTKRTPLCVRGGGQLILGQDQDIYGDGFVNLQSFGGYLQGLKLYDVILSHSELQHYLRGSDGINTLSPLLDFSQVEVDFEVHNVEIGSVQSSVYHSDKSEFNLIFPEPRTFEESKVFCHVSGGSLMIPRNSEENSALYKQSVLYAHDCSMGFIDTLWLGLIGDPVMQLWYHYDKPDLVAYTNFEKNQGLPIKSDETCVTFIGHDIAYQFEFGLWEPRDCYLKRCPVCQYNKIEILKVRGLCKQSLFDREYFLTLEDNNIVFMGVYYSKIIKRRDSTGTSAFGAWKMIRLDSKGVEATMLMKSPTDYPIGLTTWAVQNDSCGIKTMDLMITSCKYHEFSCHDGTCIPIHRRCDMENQCPDGSDEIACNKLIPPSENDKVIPPPRENMETPLKIMLKVKSLSISKIDISNFKIVTEMSISLKWFDMRLSLRNLKPFDELNILKSGRNKTWVPNLEILGGDGTLSDVKNYKEIFKVRRLTDPFPDNDENVSEDTIFSGRDNQMILETSMKITASCFFNLRQFPFDAQICIMKLVLIGVTKSYVILMKDSTSDQPVWPHNSLEYSLKAVYIYEEDHGNYSGMTVTLRLQNLSTFYMTSTYLPTFIIVIIGYLTFHFPITNFNERIMVALTGLLVEATFFSQVSSSIPNTAYLKFIDLWFVFCIVVLFLVIVSCVVIQHFEDSRELNQGEATYPKTRTKEAWGPSEDNSNSSGRRLRNDVNKIKIKKASRAAQLNKACVYVFPILILVFVGLYLLTIFVM